MDRPRGSGECPTGTSGSSGRGGIDYRFKKILGFLKLFRLFFNKPLNQIEFLFKFVKQNKLFPK
jgi:hypothetical protein